MIKKSKILLIVEGRKTEVTFFQKMSEMFHISYEIVPYSTNIYDLYKKLKEYDFSANIIDVLKLHKGIKESERELLSQTFAYIYLVFDFDCHNCCKNGVFDLKMVKQNCQQVSEMAEYFTNETDPGIGKLYINFPMFESLLDADDFYDENAKDNVCHFIDLPRYKQIVAKRKLHQIRLKDWDKENIISLVRTSLYKWNYLSQGQFGYLPYKVYSSTSLSRIVAKQQHFLLQKDHSISVLNTSILFLIDYFGIQNGFYDFVAKPSSLEREEEDSIL